MINYKWTISALDCAVNEEGLENVVKTIHWRYTGTDSDGFTAGVYGAQAVPSPNPEEFQPYENITQEIVEGWLESTLDVSEKQTIITEKINKIKNPTKITLPLPSTNKSGSTEDTGSAQTSGSI